MLSRKNSLVLLRDKIQDQKIITHCIAVEIIMRKIADRMNKNKDLWGVVGLLHDLDYEETKEQPEIHGEITAKLLSGKLPQDALRAIKAHNSEHLGVHPETPMEKALIASDGVSGLIIAASLVMPNKKLEEVELKSLKKKFKSKDFAKKVDRSRILLCEDIGFSLEEFLQLSLSALQESSHELNL
jgi:putative nucleotidyltransferase with HDIG domain